MNFNEAVFNEFPVLETERLLLREIRQSDAKEIFAIYSNPVALKYFGKDTFKSIDEAVFWVNKIHEDFRNMEGIRWGITIKDSGRYIGSGGFWRLIKQHSRAEIGYELNPEFWRKGLMTEAISAMIDFAFDKMNLHSIEANTDPENTASAKLLEKSGFEKEGYFKENYFYNGKFLDSAIYSLIKKSD